MLGHILIQLTGLASFCCIILFTDNDSPTIIHRNGLKLSKNKSDKIIKLK